MLTCQSSSMLIHDGCKLTYSMDIADRIIEARRAAGYQTTVAFAAQVNVVLKKWGYKGISREAVSMWESATVKNIRPENLAAISEVTSHTMKWLATGKGSKHEGYGFAIPQAREPTAQYGDDVLAIAQRIKKLPPSVRDAIDRVMEEMSKKRSR